MKYKLINLNTNEEVLCEKVTIKYFDYYVSDEKPINLDWVIDDDCTGVCMLQIQPNTNIEKYKKVIATNNSHINIPLVIDEIGELADKVIGLRLGSSLLKDGFIEGYTKSQETHPFSKEDMINFYEWCDTSEEAYKFWRKNQVFPDMDGSHNIIIKQKREKLFDLWLSTKPQTIYYGN